MEHGSEPCSHSCFSNTDSWRVPWLQRTSNCGHLRSCMVVRGHQNKNQASRGQACFGPSLWGHRLFPEGGWMASALTSSVARASAKLHPASGRTTHLRQVAHRRSPVCPSCDGSSPPLTRPSSVELWLETGRSRSLPCHELGSQSSVFKGQQLGKA